MKKSIINGTILTGGKAYSGKVLVFDEKILDIKNKPPLDSEIIDAKGAYVCPGFIDCHIHGYGGADTMTERPLLIADKIIKCGVTSFLPTTTTTPWQDIYTALDRIAAAMEKDNRVLGCHLEGPFISAARKGAQLEENIAEPDFGRIADYADVIKLVTYAPEKDRDFVFLDALREHGIVAAVGHSDASFEVADAAMKRGALGVTHFFNALAPLNHRNPGVIGAAFYNPDVYIELIADTIHIHPALFKMLHTIKPHKLCLITDCMEAGGMPDGQYVLGGQNVVVKDRKATLTGEMHGVLAGSVLTLDRAVYNFMSHAGLPIEKAVLAATENPARRLGLEKCIGALMPDMQADILIIDEKINVMSVYKNGVLVS